MTKEELRDSLIADGYTVDVVTKWLRVENTEGVLKYDVKGQKGNKWFTGQIKVVDEGGENETATVIAGFIETTSFAEDLKTFIRSKEVGSVYAIATREIFTNDEFATVEVYILTSSTISKKMYGVKRREGVFDFKEIV